MTTTFADVRQLAVQLTPLDQLRLIAYLAQQLAPALAHTGSSQAMPADDPWAKLAQLREELATLQSSRRVSQQLADDRAEREQMLKGSRRIHD